MRRVILALAMSVLLLAFFYTFGVPKNNSDLEKVGILSLNEDRLEKFKGLRDRLQMFSYEEGKNISYKILNANSDNSKLPALAEQLVNDKLDVLVAAGAGETRALIDVTSGIENPPAIIFMGTVSPTILGLVENEAYPSSNVTGLNNYHLDLNPKRLEIIHRMLPNVKTIALLGDQRMTSFETANETLTNVATELNIEVNTYTVSNHDEILEFFSKPILGNIDAIMLLSGFFLETSTKEIVTLATDKGIPVFGVYPGDVEKGCLASYGTSYYSQGAQSAEMVHKVLMGYSPKSIPVETPDKISFVINLKTAKNLGINLTPNILCLADQIVNR